MRRSRFDPLFAGPIDAPHFFEIIEKPHFRAEDVDNDIAGVDQHPVAGGNALDFRRRSADERPLAMIIRSAMEVFPTRSMTVISSAFRSSSALRMARASAFNSAGLRPAAGCGSAPVALFRFSLKILFLSCRFLRARSIG